MIIGHQKQLQFLDKIAKDKRIPHAILFSGPEKLGKKKVALEWISSIFGEKAQIHPDFVLIEPVNKNIEINQIRDLNWRLSLKPFRAPLKVAVLDDAHLMNSDAQNCFLKTLEEPKGNTLIILITPYPHLLFPTIVSRCQILKFYPVAKEELRDYLKREGVSEEEREKILEISLGRPGVVLEFLKNPQKLKEREERIKELMKLSHLPLASRFQYLKEILKEQKGKEVLEIWLYYFRRLLISQSDPLRLKKIKNILESIQKINFLLSTTNVNLQLALEVLMLDF